MKWQCLLEVLVVEDDPNQIEVRMDEVMTDLVDAGVEDPTIGLSIRNPGTALVELEFVVEAETLQEAHEAGRYILAKTGLRFPDGGTLVGESTRQSELIPA
jgi:hypothetical protein